MASPQPLPLAGKYKILEKLHEGGMGAIYKVEHQLLEAVRVIKMIRPQLASDSKFRRRFLEEARGATQLDHPNIAKLHDFSISDDSTTWIVMEYIPGVSLKEMVQGLGSPELPLTLEIARQTLRALGFLHRKGWVHRDISPDNIMLTEDVDHEPQVKLIDLGIAKKIAGSNDLTSAGYFFAKMRYSSPEHYKESGAEARSDLYSFGLVLYELLTGEQAIRGNDPHLLMRAHLENPPRSFEESDPHGKVPEPLRAAVMRALAKHPDDRFATGEEFAEAISTLQETYPLGKIDLPPLFDRIRARQPTKPFSTGQTQVHLDYQFGTETTPTPPTVGTYRSWQAGDGSAPTVEMHMPSPDELFEQASGQATSKRQKPNLPSQVEEPADDQRTRRISLSELTIPVRRPEPSPTETSPPRAEALEAATEPQDFPPPAPTALLDPETAQAHLETAAVMMANLQQNAEGANEPPPSPAASPGGPTSLPHTDVAGSEPATWTQAPVPPAPKPSPRSAITSSPAPPSSPSPPPPFQASPTTSTPVAPPVPSKEAKPSGFFDDPSAWVPAVEPAIELGGIQPVQAQAKAPPPPDSRYATKASPGRPGWWAELCRRIPQLEPLPARLSAFFAGLQGRGRQLSQSLRKGGSQLSPEQRSWLAAHRLHLVGAASGALLLLLLFAFWPQGKPTLEQTAVTPPPPVATTPPPPTVAPPPPTLPEDDIHPELETAQGCMAAGDTECVELALATIAEDGIELYPHEQTILEDLRLRLDEFSATAEAEVEEQTDLIDQMLLALAEGPIQALGKSYDQIYLLRQQDPSAFSEYREKFIEADKILSENRRLWSSKRKGEHLKVIAHSARLIDIFPPYKPTAVRYQKEAATAIETAAAAAEQGGNLGEAKGLLDDLQKALPSHPGLGAKIAALEGQLRADNNIQKTLDRAAQLGQSGKPHEGLAVLRQLSLEAENPYAAAHQKLQKDLANQLRTSDLHGPKIVLNGGDLPNFQRNEPIRLTFIVTDDYRVVEVMAWGRVADKGDWEQIEMESGGDQYELVISPEQHDNKKRFEFYLEAVDLSGHQSHYGQRNAPQTLRRKGLF